MALTQNQKDAAQAKRDLAKAQTAILKAIEFAWPALYVDPPKTEVGSNDGHKLSRRQTDNGVRALMLACNLTGGSVGPIQLYDLMAVYFQDPEARAEINRVVRCA